ncbi:DUF3168 domain-containing protein [Aliiruegeria sabulilitoris]|uniref:DUF3168 domain-containing protein n=1 Tax=Aliiruegeria sabulilitoris TaxID=1510458 RepID=UPI0008330EA2|nr:DUF3168 domain-containing protein [Aliiruegeria sabulilitoris]NDR56065.1 DUF3168 domain-containing protein [Pseudoruegeria sp. M32A2M]
MSYGASAALQTAVYQHLLANAEVSALVGSDVFDAAPSGTVPSVYISLGPEDVVARNDNLGAAARHRFSVSVVCETAGFQTAKTVAGAVSDALHNANPSLSRGRVVRMQFVKANARRIGDAARRRIDLLFEAVVEDA